MQPLTGVWRNVERGELQRARIIGDTLFAIAAGERTRLAPLDGGRFCLGRTSEVRFDGDPRAPTRMVVRSASDSVTFERADMPSLSPAMLAEYAGDYRSDEVDATHTWKVEKGELVVYINDRRIGVLERATGMASRAAAT